MEEENKPQKKKERFEIMEMFMATCGKGNFEKCFYGTISREKDDSGKEISCSSKIYIPKEGFVWSRAEDQRKLGELLDAIVEWRLVYGLHKDVGKCSTIAEKWFYHN